MDNEDSTAPILPAVEDRMPITLCAAPHPALLSPEELLQACDLRTQRRSGPGGQHRNKTSSGVFLTHRPSGVVGEATERRSQADNRGVALHRLRFRLAVLIRTASIYDESDVAVEADVRSKYYGKSLKLSDRNEAKPAVMALLLNDLHASGGQPSAVAARWSVSTSGIVNLIKSDGDAFALVNQIRQHHGRRGLK